MTVKTHSLCILELFVIVHILLVPAITLDGEHPNETKQTLTLDSDLKAKGPQGDIYKSYICHVRPCLRLVVLFKRQLCRSMLQNSQSSKRKLVRHESVREIKTIASPSILYFPTISLTKDCVSKTADHSFLHATRSPSLNDRLVKYKLWIWNALVPSLGMSYVNRSYRWQGNTASQSRKDGKGWWRTG